MINVIKRVSFLATLVTLLNSNFLFANNNEAMVKSLMKLRAEVELFHTRMEDEKDSYKTTMKSLSLQKNDLDAQLNRKITHFKEVEQNVKKIQALIIKRSSEDKTLKPLILSSIELLQSHIKGQIAFKTDERIKDIQMLKDQVLASLITPQKALTRLWSAYEDALRLTKENGLFKQTILLDGEHVLAEVAKIGMMMVYFKTPDEKVGYLKGDKYIELVGSSSKANVLALFDAIKKQIRTGFFTLPNALNMEVK